MKFYDVHRNLGAITLMFTLLSFVGCSSFKAERVSDAGADEKAMTITDHWVDGDTNLVIAETMKQVNSHPRLIKYKSSHPGKDIKLFVGVVANNTSEAYFPGKDLEEALLNQVSKSDVFVLVDAEQRSRLLKEITYQNDGMVDPAQAKTIGKQSGADMMIFGSINMKPEERDGRKIKTYAVNFRLTEIQSSEEVCRTRTTVSKYSQQSASGW